MTDVERFKLLGCHKSPTVKVGSVLTCEFRDTDVIVVGFTDALIPWPLGRRRGSGARGIILFGDLAGAVWRESNQAVCHWFGGTPQTVSHWRKALGVGLANEGTHRLRSDYTEEDWAREALKKGQSKSGDPERRRKVAESRKGKKRPAHVIKAMIEGRMTKGVSEETRRKMSVTHKARGTYPPAAGRPWTATEDELVCTLPAAEVVRRTGHPLLSVYERRRTLGLPDGRRRKMTE